MRKRYVLGTVVAASALAAALAFGAGLRVAIVPARRDDGPGPLMPFIDEPDVAQYHEIVIRAPSDVVSRALETFDMQSLPMANVLMRLRARLMGGAAQKARAPRGLVDAMRALGWVVLSEKPGGTTVLGAVAQPWLPNVRFIGVAPAAFAAYAEPGYVKIAWTLEVERIDPATTRLRTETRVEATDGAARAAFERYWSRVAPGSSLIRIALLRAVRRSAERAYLES